MARWEADSQLISLSVVSSALRNLVRWQDMIHQRLLFCLRSDVLAMRRVFRMARICPYHPTDDAPVVFESCGFAVPVALKSDKSPGVTS